MWKYLALPVLILTACASTPAANTADLIAPRLSVPIPNLKPHVPSAAEKAQIAAKFAAWKQDFTTRAIAKGYDANLVNSVIKGATLRPAAIKSNNNQSEFTKPVWSYVKTAASTERLAQGSRHLVSQSALFDRLETAYGVDRHVLTAIWGLESGYGSNLGSYDPKDALATFAFDGRRMSFGETQLFAILDLLRSGQVRRNQLKATWAGAMGMTQFIPATFRDYAVDFDRDGNKDLWTNKGDALGSAANYLSRSGWVTGQPVFAEIMLPNGFDYSLSDGRKLSVSQWEALGAKPIQGGGFSPNVSMIGAKLYVPAGARGPKLLTFKNFDVIKRYNNSNSYAMGITTLALGFTSTPAITASWPESDEALSLTQKKKLQEALSQQGFDTGGVDGLIGPNSQKAIRGWQSANGLVPDGYVEKRLWLRILKSAGVSP